MTPLTKRLTVALVISVALNLLLVGFFVGKRLDRRHQPGMGPGAAGMHGPRPMRDEALRELLKGTNVDLRARREATRTARAAVEASLEREPFDKAALDKSLSDLRGETVKSQEALHTALADAAAKGNLEQRRRLAQAFGRERRGKR